MRHGHHIRPAASKGVSGASVRRQPPASRRGRVHRVAYQRMPKREPSRHPRRPHQAPRQQVIERLQRYVRELLAGLDAYPAYYAHMGPANAAGPAGPELSPPHRADTGELQRRIGAGEWVVDLRARRAFAAGHLAGTLSFGLDGSLATYLGWLIPWGTPLTLLGQTPEQVAQAQRELARIGIDQPAAMAAGEPGAVVRRPPAAPLPGRRLQRPGSGPPPPPRDDRGRAARPGVGRLPHRRRHPPAPA